jgi:hypothetical protein
MLDESFFSGIAVIRANALKITIWWNNVKRTIPGFKGDIPRLLFLVATMEHYRVVIIGVPLALIIK